MKGFKKAVLFMLTAVLGSGFCTAPAHAQADGRIRVNIPFDFIIGDHALKAGDYRIVGQDGFVCFTSPGQQGLFAIGGPSSLAGSRGTDAYLVFSRYGDEAYLTNVVFSADAAAEFQLTRKQKQHIAKLQSRDLFTLLIEPRR